MFRLSQTQLDGFRQRASDTFYDKLRTELRDFMTSKLPNVLSDEREARISQAFLLCQQHRFSTEKQITRLCFIVVTFPYDFPKIDKYQWFSGLIASRASAEVRLDRIKACIAAGSRNNG